jgi:nucleoside-diphosphate-sugar epimerase
LLQAPDWKVYGVSRRAPRFSAGTPRESFVHLEVDLTDAQAARRVLGACGDVTHVFYCANDGDRDTRLAMIANVLDAVERAAAGFSNINLLQGTKYYASHLGPFRTPAKESDPRTPGADFYYSEEDLVVARQRGKQWTWTAVRPHSVCGYAAGNPMNLASLIGIYGSILRELRQPFGFPASQRCFETLFDVCDSGILSRAAIWVSTTAKCGNQAFNVNNGDYFRWQHLWPALAAFFGLAPAGPQPYLMAEFLRDKKQLWESIAAKHGLRAFPFDRAPGWAQGDYSPPHSRFACEYDLISDLVKIRQHGFCEALDSGQMFLRVLARLRDEKVIP